MTVRKKVMLGLMGFSLIPILIITIVCMRTSANGTNSLYDDRLKAVAQTSAMAFQEIVGLYKDEIAVFSTCVSVRNYVDLMSETGGPPPESSAQAVALNNYLQNYIGAASKFSNILILDKDGKAIVSYLPEAKGLELGEADYFQRIITHEITNEGQDYIHISQVHPSLTEPENPKSNYIGISRALYSGDGEFRGVLVGILNATELGKFAQNIKFGKTGLAFVIDSQNFILYHPEPRFLNTKTEAPKLQNMIMRYQSGRLSSEGKIVDIMNGVKRNYYYVILGPDEIALVLRQDYDEASGDIVFNVTLLSIMFLAAAAVTVYFGFRMSKSFVSPILKIKEAFDTSRVQGKYIRCEVSSDDEIGAMAAGYNEMIRALETQYQLLQNEKSKVERIAMRDSITDLNNRSAFESGLGDLIRNGNDSFGVIFLDMDGFKQINDVLGHDFGDTLLYMLGRRIKNSAAKFDIYARLGGDEFGLVKIGTREDVYEAAQILMNELRSPFRIEMHTLHVTTSLGGVMYPYDGDSVETLIKNADIAMYYSKGNGKNMFSFFDDEMQKRVNRQSMIMGVLRKGIEKEEIYFVYQPELDIKTGKIVAYEALMRINNADLGPVSPNEFIPIAETNNSLINNLGHWTLVQACRFARKMVDEHGFDGVIAVNISVMQLRRDNFVDEVVGVLEEEKLEGKYLQLELTESILMFDMENNAKKLAKLRAHGISVAMDDFGTHYSSFNYLLKLPLDVIKIDREFFSEIETNDRMLYLCETISDVAHKLGLKVVAEGVETERQYNLMTKIGCDALQGFHFSRPLFESDVSGWHQANKDN